MSSKDFVDFLPSRGGALHRLAAAWRVLRGQPTIYGINFELHNCGWEEGGGRWGMYLDHGCAFERVYDGGPSNVVIKGQPRKQDCTSGRCAGASS